MGTMVAVWLRCVRGRVMMAAAILCVSLALCAGADTALDEYVARPDSSYAIEADSSFQHQIMDPDPVSDAIIGECTVYIGKMTSQTWRAPDEVDRTLWEHWLLVIVPPQIQSRTALLWIGGGKNTDGAPTELTRDDELAIAEIAARTQSVCAVLRMVPNQRLKFADEWDLRYMQDGRTEDELIAYCWDKFRATGDAEWLPRLPMTKAVVRAMDSLQNPDVEANIGIHDDGLEGARLQQFVVAGGSKRGWTTWTTAVVDPRVAAIAPCVIDLLNLRESMHHHWDAYGYWAAAISDYEELGSMDWLDSDEFTALAAVVDPYSYLSRPNMDMPKYIVNSTGDQFFLPDSSQFYFDALQGDRNYLRYVPNTDHGGNKRGFEDLEAFYVRIAYDAENKLPQFSWEKQADGTLVVDTAPGRENHPDENIPDRVRLRWAHNLRDRNFRLDTIGPNWGRIDLEAEPDEPAPGVKRYIAGPGHGIDVPTDGYVAFFIELKYKDEEQAPDFPLTFTTEVSVVPDTLPYAEADAFAFQDPGGWGSIETVGPGADAVAVVRLGGNRYQMGYWYGRLLADQIAHVCEGVADSIDFAGAEDQADDAIYAMWNADHFDTAAWFDELCGVADGCAYAGRKDVTVRALQRAMMLSDVAVPEGSLFASWGSATGSGGAIQMHNLDWYLYPHKSGGRPCVQDRPVVAIYHPDNGCRHAVVGFAGVLGAIGGGINEHGIGIAQIAADLAGADSLDGVPASVLMRDILWHASSMDEVRARIVHTEGVDFAPGTRKRCYCVAAGGADSAQGRLFFASPEHFAESSDTALFPPDVDLFGPPDPFAAMLPDTVYWSKPHGLGNEALYNAVQAPMAGDGTVNVEQAIAIARAVGVEPAAAPVQGTLLSVVSDTAARELWVAYAEGADRAAHTREYVRIALGGPQAGVGGSGYLTSASTEPGDTPERTLPIAVVGGTPFEMGYHYGQLMEADINACIPAFLDY
ncbi:MAG: hypothetical protein JXR94_03005, partial [Candidatus Hydrogenedentes bacterium]|nr:hypothetical protein [Candidatus Hydrogenedentota bacterium]